MKQEILLSFVLCNCILLLAQRTLANELAIRVGYHGDRTKATADFGKGIEEGSLVENSATYATLSATVELNSDNISDFEVPAVQTAVNDTEFKKKVYNATESEEDNAITDIEEVVPSATPTPLYVKILLSETYLSKIEKGTLIDPYFATTDPDKQYLTEVAPQSADDLRISKAKSYDIEGKFKSANVNDIDGKSAIEVAEPIEENYVAVTAILDTELTTIAIGETVTDVSMSTLYKSDESKMNDTSSERSTTDVTPEELVKLSDAITTEMPSIPVISLCTAPGIFAEDSDCRSYFICRKTVTNKLRKIQETCPIEQAFDKTRLRCSRNLSPCADAFDCKVEGAFADPTDNPSYYLCVASRLNVEYHIYHVRCGRWQIYTPELGKCSIDLKYLQNMPLTYSLLLKKSADEKRVRREVYVLKAEEKVKLRDVKLREKMRRKYERQLLHKGAIEAWEG